MELIDVYWENDTKHDLMLKFRYFLMLIQVKGAGIAQQVQRLAYGLENRGVGVRVPVGSRIFSSSELPAWLWGSSSLLYDGDTFP
jgi:hypothetical protein